MRAQHWPTHLVALLIAVAHLVTAQAGSPLRLAPSDLVDPAAFQVTVFADRLFFPMGLAPLPGDALLAGVSIPAGGSFFASTGALIRLVDRDRDGIADGPGVPLAEGIGGTIVAIARSGRLVFVTSAAIDQEQIMVFRRGRSWAEPLTFAGAITFAFPGFLHRTYGLAARPVPGQPNRHEVIFNIGAAGNDAGGGVAQASGLVEAELPDSSLYRVIIADTGTELRASELEQIATGLRNASAIVFTPSGDLLFLDNGIDTPGNELVALSADELNRIPAAEIGGTVEDFGFPHAYIDYRSGVPAGEGGRPPEIAFVPVRGSESEGASSLALAPPGFPKGLSSGVFVGFHGQWDLTGLANEENPVVYADPAQHTIVPFVANDDPIAGHIDSLVSTDTTLYLADLCGGPQGSLSMAEPCGTIYAIRVVQHDQRDLAR
ncbi:MAG: hypothetical protein KatS3mg059_0919 [Thermomicrobiales bacterium]|nr:MAG: hypothetical protein KatS3mg059_0919 [Thermomicrobiales bacterium]